MSKFRNISNAVGSGFIGFIAHPFALAYHTTEYFRSETMDITKPWWLRAMFGGATLIIGAAVAFAGGIGIGWFMMPVSGYYAGRNGYTKGFVEGCKASFSHDFDRFIGRMANSVWNFFSACKKSVESTCCPTKEPDSEIIASRLPSNANKSPPREQKECPAITDFRGPATLPPGQSLLYTPGSKLLPSQQSPNIQHPTCRPFCG